MGKVNIEDQIKDFGKIAPKPKKKKINSKSKGKSGERYFVDIFKKESDGLPFVRIPNSGAFIGRSNRRRITELTSGQIDNALGDIMCPSFLKKRLILESKNYEDLEFHKMTNSKLPTKLIGWMEELEFDTETAYLMQDEKKPLPLLLIKINRKGSFVVFNIKAFETLGPNCLETLNYTCFNKPIINKKLIEEGYLSRHFMVDFNEFVEANKEKLFEVNDAHPHYLEWKLRH